MTITILNVKTVIKTFITLIAVSGIWGLEFRGMPGPTGPVC